MATTKIPVRKEALNKINKLFAYRRITTLLKTSGLDANKDFVANLINVQYQIYLLDEYLEKHWELDKTALKKLWAGIHLALASMALKPKAIKELLKEIKDYEMLERSMRKDKWPTKESMKDFYFAKSCDIRLIRRLIYNVHPGLKKHWKEKDWMYYDIITEINDDIADVKEDLQTFNGNRFLISILRKGRDKTLKEYKSYLNKIAKKSDNLFAGKLDSGQNKLLKQWTSARSGQTMKLLESHIKSATDSRFSSSVLLSNMK